MANRASDVEKELNDFDPMNWRYRDLKFAKKECLKIAKELLYPETTLTKIKNAETVADVENAMRHARENYL